MLQGLKRVFFLVGLIVCSAQLQAQTFHVSHGASSVDISIKSSEAGMVYYALYTSKLTNTPTEQLIKNPSTLNLTKSGRVTLSSSQLNTALTRTLVNLKDSVTYYLYLLFESNLGVSGGVRSYTLSLPKRQPSYGYLSQATGTLNKEVQYLFYKPESYLKDTTNRKFPMILFFHGILGGSDVSAVRNSGLPQFIDSGNEVDFLVVSPRMNNFWPGSWYSPGSLDELFDLIKKTARVDTNKIYIAGLSGGGGGVYYFSAHRPNEIAAIWECSCVNVFWNPDFPFGPNYCLIKDIPFWGFHNSGDTIVTLNNSNEVIKQIEDCIPAPIVAPKLTVNATTNHYSWNLADKNPAVYKWLLGYTKKAPLNKQPLLTNDSIVNITSSASEIQLQAIANDPDKTGMLSYEWYLLKGGDVTLQDNFSKNLILSDFKQGTYLFRLLVTDGGGSRNFKDISLTIKMLATELLPLEDLKEESKSFVYPNPCSEKIYFKVRAGEVVSYKIIGMSGFMFLEGKSDTVNVSSLPNGIYSIETNQGNYKFTKQ